jgi:hypothetical protein
MKIIETNLVGKEFSFLQFDEVLHSLGFDRGAMWDRNYAIYDHPLEKSKIGKYVYLRICTEAVLGEIEESHCTLRVDDVFLTGAIYHQGLNFNLEVDKKYMDKSKELLNKIAGELGATIQQSFREPEEQDLKQRTGYRKH